MIRFLLRFIGLLLLALAFIFVIYDGMKSIADATFYATKLAQIWTEIHGGSLQSLQALVERSVSPRRMAMGRSAGPAAAGRAGVRHPRRLLILLGRKKRPLIGYARD